MTRGTSVVLLAALLSPSLAPGVAYAVEKKACGEAYEKTQKLKKKGSLAQAKDAALFCAQEGCPQFIRDECASYSVEIDKSMPTIVVAVVDGEGGDVPSATVTLDGNEIAYNEGKAIALDPGTHKLRVERKGGEPIEQEVVAREGEKNRRVKIKVEAAAAEKPPVATSEPEDAPPHPPAPAATPTSTWVFGGIGLVGLIGFAAFGAMGASQKKDLDARGCKPDCPQADVDKAKQSFLFADIGLGIGVLGLGLATVMYLTRGEETKPVSDKSSRARFDVAGSPRGAAATFTWSF